MAEPKPELVRQVLKCIDGSREEYVEFLRRLVMTNTTIIDGGYKGGNEASGQELVIQFLTDLNCEVDVFQPNNDLLARYPDFNSGHEYGERPNVVGVLRGRGGGRSLILNGHIDTMPVADGEAWQHEPFGGVIAGGRLYGRGATDMKGGLASALCAVKTLVECGVSLCGDVIVESVVDEEGGGNGTLACIDRGYTAEGAIVAEPTDMQIVVAGMGWTFYEIEIEGAATHAGSKWKGTNAIEKAMKIIEELRELERMWLMTYKHPLLPGPTINLGKIEGGEGASTVPGKCVMTVGVHYQPAQSDESGYWSRVEDEVLGRIRCAARGDPWLSRHEPRVRRIQQGTPHELDVDHPLVSTLSDSVLHVTGKRPQVGGAGYGCDARLLSNLAGVPTVVFGPGEPVEAHKRDESISIEDYINSVKVNSLAILNWCGVCDSNRSSPL